MYVPPKPIKRGAPAPSQTPDPSVSNAALAKGASTLGTTPTYAPQPKVTATQAPPPTPPSNKGVTANGKNGPVYGNASSSTDDSSDLSDLAKLRQQQQKEYQAAQQQLAASKAQALQQADARAGLGGFGLSGASAALHGDINRTQDQSNTIALGQLSQQQRDEQWQEVQRQIALNDLESQTNTDLNGDGVIGGDQDPKAKKKQTAADAQAIDANLGGSGKDNDPYGGIGGASQGSLQSLLDAGVTFSQVRAETGTFNGEKYVVALGSDGNWYKFKVPGSGLGNTPDDNAAIKWFDGVQP